MSVRLLNNLQRYLESRVPGSKVDHFQFLVSGFESDLYTFDLQPASGESMALILRVYPGDGMTDKLLREARGVRLLREAGYPVPAILYLETSPTHLGKPFSIMERLTGKSLWPLLYQVPPREADRLLERFGALVAGLHKLDWRPFKDRAGQDHSNPARLIDDLLAPARALHTRFGVDGFNRVVNWLESRKFDITVRPAVVHMDFHANNVFLGDDERMSVLDWTQIGVSDYRADLSWTLMIMGDYGKPEWRERILLAYEKEAGYLVDDLDYFAVYSDLKLLASTVISRRVGPAALGLRPGVAESPEQQKSVLLRLSERIRQHTGVSVPEVDEILQMP